MNELWLAAAIIVYENGEYFMKPIGVVTDLFMWITGVVMRG